MDSLEPDDSIKQKKKTRLIILIAALLIIVAIIVIMIIVASNAEDDNKENPSPTDDTPYKPTSTNTVKLPEGIKYDGNAIFSATGKILFQYKKQNDKDSIYFGVMDEDGTNLKQLWGGVWKNYYESNGIRLMPFTDNKRILTGDYILECTPNIDECTSSKLFPVIYPTEVVNLEEVYMVWSEIIVSPDEHIGWSTLSHKYEDVNFIAKLQRNENNYTMTNVQVISAIGFVEYEDKEKGLLKATEARGGEIKQFIEGGEAITLAGGGKEGLAKSVYQSLVNDNYYQITHFPGYEETTIISPDGKLGLVMTTRFSPKSSSQILGIMPRPYSAYTLSKMNMFIYIYGILSVRKFRPGNIGPAVINITESINNRTYMGYDLHDDGWAFNSPLSWHPNSNKGMFSEVKQNVKEEEKRIRIVKFDNYKPSKIEENKKTPDNIPYAKTLDALKGYTPDINGYFKGKEGMIIFNRTANTTRAEYKNYSDDGKTFYNGYEQCDHESQAIGTFTSNVIMSGEKEGKMDLKITMSVQGQVIYEKDGQKLTYGYVYYNGKNLTVEESYS